MKSILVGLVIIGCAMAYVNYRDHVKTRYLLSYAALFSKQCQTQSGCTIKPAGWAKFTENSYYDPNAEYPIGYSATHNTFELSWKIATGVTLVATGGKNQAVIVEKEVD